MISRTPVLDRLLDPVGRSFTPEVARQIADLRADAETQARIDTLAAKCSNGELTQEEAAEYDIYVNAIDFITILQAKARTVLDEHATV